jgi:hypothetical protein
VRVSSYALKNTGKRLFVHQRLGAAVRKGLGASAAPSEVQDAQDCFQRNSQRVENGPADEADNHESIKSHEENVTAVGRFLATLSLEIGESPRSGSAEKQKKDSPKALHQCLK